MADGTVHADFFLAMAFNTPTHRVVHFPLNPVHLVYLAVTRRTINAGADVRLVGKKNVGRFIDPIHPPPSRLLGPPGDRGQLLNLGAFRLHRFVTLHALRDIRDGGVRGFISVVVAGRSFEFRTIFFGFLRRVLPMIERYRLSRLVWLADDTRQEDQADEPHHDKNRYEFPRSHKGVQLNSIMFDSSWNPNGNRHKSPRTKNRELPGLRFPCMRVTEHR